MSSGTGFLPQATARAIRWPIGGLVTGTRIGWCSLHRIVGTRCTRPISTHEWPRAGRSVVCYGVPVATSISGSPQRQAETLAWEIQNALVRFEPRLANLRVRTVVVSGGASALPMLELSGEIRTAGRLLGEVAGTLLKGDYLTILETEASQ